jgi:hypothetical protein
MRNYDRDYGICGGSWGDRVWYSSVTFRDRFSSSDRFGYLGFRLARRCL